MDKLNLPYKVRRYINENKKEIDACILNAVEGKKKTDLYITDLDIIVDYILDYSINSTEFYQSIINYCKYFLEEEGYFVKLYTENLDELDWLSKIESYSDDKFKPMMTVFSDEKTYKRANMVDEGLRLTGGLIGLITMFTES